VADNTSENSDSETTKNFTHYTDQPHPVKPLKLIRPRPRPPVTEGRTIEINVGCGTLYVTINEDDQGIAEVFVRLGKAGGCAAAQTEAIGRLISIALRSYIDPEEVVRQLKGIRCPHVGFNKGVMTTSCADAVAKVLESYLKGEFTKKFRVEDIIPLTEFIGGFTDNGDESKVKGSNKQPTSVEQFATKEVSKSEPKLEDDGEQPKKQTTSTMLAGMSCPDCGSPMIYSEGCMVCTSCGYSKCG